jgi:hypothetical protein
MELSGHLSRFGHFFIPGEIIPWYPFYGRLVLSQNQYGRFGEEKNILLLP